MKRREWIGSGFIAVTLIILPTIIFATDLSGSWSGYFYGDWSTTKQQIDLIINQTGEVIEASSEYRVSGISGNFSGTGEGERYTVQFSHAYDSCNFSGTAQASLRGGVLAFEANGRDCNGIEGTARGAVVRTGSTLSSEASWLNIEKRKYPSELMKASLWSGVDDPSEKINSVAIITPKGAKIEGFVIDPSELPKRWETGYEMPLSHLEDIWPDGIYVHDITLIDGNHEYIFTMVSGNFPGQFPNLTSHENEDYLDPAVDNLLEWDPWTADPGLLGTVYLGLGDSFYESKTSTSLRVPAGSLPVDEMEDFGVNFHFYSLDRSAKNMATDYYLRTGNHVVSEAWLIKAKVITEPGDEIGLIVAGLEGVDVKSVQLKKPDGTIAFSLAKGEKADGEWEGGAVVTESGQLESLFPDGIYTMAITYSDDAVGTITKEIAGEYPSSYPAISVPLAGTTVDWNRDFQASWDEWEDFSAPDTFVVATVSPLAGAAMPAFKSDEVWGTTEGIGADGVLVPPGVLPPGQEYGITILFAKGSLNGEWKAKGRMRSFRSSVKQSGQFSWNLFLPAIIKAH